MPETPPPPGPNLLLGLSGVQRRERKGARPPAGGGIGRAYGLIARRAQRFLTKEKGSASRQSPSTCCKALGAPSPPGSLEGVRPSSSGESRSSSTTYVRYSGARGGWRAAQIETAIARRSGLLSSPSQGFAATGNRKGAPNLLKAFIAAIAIVRSTRSFGAKASEAAAYASSDA